MSRSITVTVRANPDLDDCLAGAAAEYIEQHPQLRGYNLLPRWTDPTERETVDLTVPSDAFAVRDYNANTTLEGARRPSSFGRARRPALREP